MRSNIFGFGFFFWLIMVVYLIVALIKRREKMLAFFKCTEGTTLIAMVLTYVILAALGYGSIGGVFAPYRFFGTDNGNALFLMTALAGLCYLGIVWLVKNAKKKTFDVLLGVLSLIIPLVGLVLCIVNRSKKEKDIPASNVYLALCVVPPLLSVFVLGALSIFNVI